eukprot:TRINITY_DN2854_c0_g1_i1.p1 TRINITY_DN2854_c0_g1~~TRINITY_DN2854_c0_g1_i1.p1  ORF type:complete len:786 (-),score=227.08 TRINITY_DN2854_c0_g1_i1:181-2538(-)
MVAQAFSRSSSTGKTLTSVTSMLSPLLVAQALTPWQDRTHQPPRRRRRRAASPAWAESANTPKTVGPLPLIKHPTAPASLSDALIWPSTGCSRKETASKSLNNNSSKGAAFLRGRFILMVWRGNVHCKSNCWQTQAVDRAKPGLTRTQSRSGKSGQGSTFSPIPVHQAVHPARKKGTSAPRPAARRASSAGARAWPCRELRAMSAAAASELPPPRPAATGMRLTSSKEASAGRSAASKQARAAASTRLSSPASSGRSQLRLRPAPPKLTSRVSTKSTGCIRVASWWQPSSRRANIRRQRLTLAGAVTASCMQSLPIKKGGPMRAPPGKPGLLFGRLDHHEQGGVAPLDKQQQAVAGLELARRLGELGHAVHRLLGHLQDHVAAHQAGLGPGAAIGHSSDDQALLAGDAQLLGQVRGEHLQRKAQLALLGLAGLGLGLPFGLELADGHLQGPLLAAAHHLHGDLLAHRGLGHQARQGLHILDLLAVKAHDHVAARQAGLGRRAARDHIGHQGPHGLVQAELLGQFLGHRLDGNPQPAADDPAGGPELGHDLLGGVDRDGEADALSLGHDGGVDAHHLALEVDQGAAGVARVDAGIGLQEVVIGTGADDAALGADDARGHGVLQAEGVAHGQNPVAHPELVAVAQGQEGQLVLGVYFNKGQVGLGVAAYNLGRKLIAALEAHQDLVGLGHHVVVGDHIALGVHDDAGAQSALFEFAGMSVAARPALTAEEAAEEFMQVRDLALLTFLIRSLLLPGEGHDAGHGALLDGLDDANVHYRRADLAGQVGE